jgi:hypothetical protein
VGSHERQERAGEGLTPSVRGPRPYRSSSRATSVRPRWNRWFEAQTPCPGRTPADANECEQSGEAPNHLPAMSHRSPLAFRNSRREVGATLKIILADIKRCDRGKSGDSDAAASRFRNGLSVLEFRQFF